MKEDNNTIKISQRLWRTFKRFVNEKKVSVDLIIILVVTLLSFILAFSRYSVMEYMDGGYYYLQVQSLLSSGMLYYEAPPLFFLIAAIFGNIEIGIRIAASLMIALQVPSYFITLYIIRGRKEAYITLPLTFWNLTFYNIFGDLTKNLTSLIFVPLVLAFLWSLWKEKKRFFVMLTFLLLSTFCMITSHLPAALVGLLSSGTLIILLLLDIITKKPKEIVTQLKTIKNNLFGKEFKALLDHNLIRIGLGLIAIVIGTLLGFAINAIFPIQPQTWYSSSDLPSSAYGNAETTVLSLFRFFTIFSQQFVFFIIAFCLLIISRPKGWQIPLSILLSVLAIDFTISSASWTHRLNMDLEVGRIIMLVILIGSFIDFMAKEDSFDKLKSLISKEKTKKKKNIKREKRIKQILTGIAIIALIIFISIPSIRMSSHGGYQPGNPIIYQTITTEERSELSSLGETLQENYAISDCIIYARHGLEYWISVETGFECKSTSTHHNFIEFMEEVLKESRTVFIIISDHEFPVIGRVPLVTPPSETISGPWGHLNTPHPQTFLGDNNYTIEMIFSPPPETTIKNATSTVWVSYGPDNKTFLNQESLNIQPINPTTFRISNQNSSNQAEICSDYNFLILSITVNFEEQEIQPFILQFPVFGGVAPFELYQRDTYYRTLNLNSSFRLADEGYPSELLSLPGNQEELKQDLFSIILLWPYSIFEGLYLKLIIAYPISIMQSYAIFLLIIIIARKIRKRIKIKTSSENKQFSEENT